MPVLRTEQGLTRQPLTGGERPSSYPVFCVPEEALQERLPRFESVAPPFESSALRHSANESSEQSQDGKRPGTRNRDKRQRKTALKTGLMTPLCKKSNQRVTWLGRSNDDSFTGGAPSSLPVLDRAPCPKP